MSESIQDYFGSLPVVVQTRIMHFVPLHTLRTMAYCGGYARVVATSYFTALFDDMLKRGCEPNQHTYAPILKAFCEEGRIWEMKQLMETMFG